MVLPADDASVLRGHAIYDTIHLVNGHLYQLPEALDRLFASCQAARIVPPLGIDDLRRVILHTAAASTSWDGVVKVWVSGGRGDVKLSDLGKGRGRACLYVTVTPLAVEEPDLGTCFFFL